MKLIGLFLSLMLIANNQQRSSVLGSATQAEVLVNEYRQQNGLPPLIYSSTLDVVSSCRAKYLYDRSQWSHNNMRYCFTVNGVYPHYGENLARNFSNDSQIVNTWIVSPSHRDNMLRPEWKHIGYAKYNNYVVLSFSQRER